MKEGMKTLKEGFTNLKNNFSKGIFIDDLFYNKLFLLNAIFENVVENVGWTRCRRIYEPFELNRVANECTDNVLPPSVFCSRKNLFYHVNSHRTANRFAFSVLL